MINELNRFIQVAHNGNVTKTAEKLFITQSALTQSIQRLEKELGTKLFAQKGKHLQLTSNGAAIVEIGTRILDLWERAKNTSARQTMNSRYTIGAFDNAALKLGGYFQKQIRQKTIELELIIQTSGKLLSQLQLGILDVAICVIDKKTPVPHDLLLLKSFTEGLIPVSSKIFKESIENVPFILYNKDSFSRLYIDEKFTKKGISPKIFAESTSVSFMKELAILGSGVALLPENSVKTELKQKLLKKQKLNIKWQREYGIYVAKQSSLQKDHPLIRDLIHSLK